MNINTVFKGLLWSFLIIGSILISTAAIAQTNPITLVVNGVELKSDVSPEIKNGRTMVPIRVIAEALEADVYYNDESKTVFIVEENGEKSDSSILSYQSHLVGVQGNDYVEGQYPVHLTYDLNAVKRYITGREDGGDYIRDVFAEMANSSIKDVDSGKRISEEKWRDIYEDIDTKLALLDSLDEAKGALDQPVWLFSQFLEEAKNGDYARYVAVVNGIDFLSRELQQLVN